MTVLEELSGLLSVGVRFCMWPLGIDLDGLLTAKLASALFDMFGSQVDGSEPAEGAQPVASSPIRRLTLVR